MSDERGHAVWAKYVTVALLAMATGWQCIGAWTDSQTTDEAVHLVAGYSYLRTNDHRLNPEHPPLLKLLAALPLLAVPDLAFDLSDSAWITAEQWGLGADFLFQSRPDPRAGQWILFLGRLIPIAVTITLAWLLGWWARRRWGPWAGVLATGLFVFEPTILGHGHLVTTDMAVSLGIVATLVCLERFLAQPRWSRLMILTTCFALTQTVKFSAIILWFIVPLIVIGAVGFYQPRLSWRWVGRLGLALIVLTPLMIWTVYGFEVKPFATDSRINQALATARTQPDPSTYVTEPPLTKWLIDRGRPGTFVGDLIQSAAPLPIPAYSYFRGLIETSNHNFWGHTASFFGDVREHGWWQYFPVAILVKTPLIILTSGFLLAGLALWLWWRRRPRSLGVPLSFWLIGLPPIVFLLWSMTSHINIGVRHVLPVMVFFPLWVAAGLAQCRLPTRWRWSAVGLLVGGLSLTSLFAWPHTIGYFNALVGGTRNGHAILQDSNLDWNQDTWRLRDYLDRQGLKVYGLGIPGGRHELFFPEAGTVPTDTDVQAFGRQPGTYFLTVAVLYDQNNPFHWLWSESPTAIIATAIYRFDIR